MRGLAGRGIFGAMKIFALQPAHHPELLSLIEDFETHPGFSWNATQLAEELKVGHGWGLWQQDHLAAFVLGRENDQAFEIMLLGTAPLYRRQGAMRALLQAVIAGSQKAIWLEVHQSNEAAIKLYHDLGFQPTGARKNYYSDGASALLMSFLRKDF